MAFVFSLAVVKGRRQVQLLVVINVKVRMLGGQHVQLRDVDPSCSNSIILRVLPTLICRDELAPRSFVVGVCPLLLIFMFGSLVYGCKRLGRNPR